MTIGERIKKARENAGLTQSELSAQLGIPYQSISQWERGIRNPKLNTLKKIAEALGVEWVELYADSKAERLEAVKHDSAANIVWEKSKGDIKYQVAGKSGMGKVRQMTKDDIFEMFENDSRQREKYFSLYDRLNFRGKAEAIKRVEELTEIPKYRKRENQKGENPEEK